jgi:putative flippase GtrA
MSESVCGESMRTLLGESWRFGIIGFIGFLIDAAFLTFLVRAAEWGLYESRALSFSVAVTATWYLNRLYTFRHRSSDDLAREYGRYFAVQTLGSLINLAVYVAVIAALPVLASTPVLPLAVGSALAMGFNFAASKGFAFVGRPVS